MTAAKVEGVAQAVAGGMHPQMGQKPDQLSPDLSRSMTAETLAAAREGKGRPTDAAGTGKVPRGARWQDRATTDRDAVTKFWIGDGKYPKNSAGKMYSYPDASAVRNVNIAFPEREDCELFVLDIDGEAGKAALAALEADYGPLPQTWKSDTPSGGLHLIFKAAGVDIRKTASVIAPGVDIRGKNGQIVAPPSIHPNGGFYRWAEGCAPWECEVAEAPIWLRKLSFEATKGRAEGAGRGDQPKAKTKRKKASGAKPSGSGWQKHLDEIGDGECQKGFDAPINKTACAYFGQVGVDADAEPLKEALLDAILGAPCDDDRAVSRYATDDYLDERIEGAREHIGEQDEPAPVSYDTATLNKKIKDAELNEDSSDADFEIL